MLMRKMYGEGEFDLTGIHCLECEGYPTPKVYTSEGEGILTGYVEVEGGEPLLHVSYPKPKVYTRDK